MELTEEIREMDDNWCYQTSGWMVWERRESLACTNRWKGYDVAKAQYYDGQNSR
jgi:hypothetical protein